MNLVLHVHHSKLLCYRYKDSINQTIVEEFAQEILFYNFTNSQLEIDDGYESAYGNFVFDQNKFPDAKEMISKIHDMVSFDIIRQ